MTARSVFFVVFDLCISVVGEAQFVRTQIRMPATEAVLERIVFEEVIHYYRRQEQLEAPCHAGYAVRGCTDFPDEQLKCWCVEIADGWRIVAVARIRAQIHVLKPRTVLHERQHLADLKQRLDDHLSRVLEPFFTSEGSCKMKAKVMSTPQYLRDVMNRLRIESNAKFQCS